MEQIISLIGLDSEKLTMAILSQIILALGGATYTIIKTLKFVNEGEEGIRLRFGKAVRKNGVPKVIRPGLIILIPFAENLKKRHVRQQTIQFKNVKVLVNKRLPFIINASLIFRVTDIYKALFEVNNLEANITDYGSHVLYSVISEIKEEDVSKLDIISEDLLQRISKKAKEWGIEFMFFNLNSIVPTSETASYMTVGPTTQARAKALKAVEEQIQDIHISPSLAAALIGHQVTSVLPGDNTIPIQDKKEKK